MSKQKKGIPSPFIKEVRGNRDTVTASQVEKVMVMGFIACLEAHDLVKEKATKMTLTTYLAGFTTTLCALGYSQKDALELTNDLADAIVNEGAECNCDKCKKT